jgi:hypothetical protein
LSTKRCGKLFSFNVNGSVITVFKILKIAFALARTGNNNSFTLHTVVKNIFVHVSYKGFFKRFVLQIVLVNIM